MDAFFRARLSLDLGAPLLEQLVADRPARATGERPARRTGASSCATSRDAALAASREHLPDWRLDRPTGGLNLWCELPDRPLSTALVPRAPSSATSSLPPGPSFAPEGGLDRFVRCPTPSPPTCWSTRSPGSAVAWQETLADPGLRLACPDLVA